MTNRNIRLGIDFGTSATKVVARDIDFPGGERWLIVAPPSVDAAEFRWTSDLWIDREGGVVAFEPPRSDLASFEQIRSLKTLVAGEACSDFRRLHAGSPPEPLDLTWAELAQLKCRRLVQEAWRQVEGLIAAERDADTPVLVGVRFGFPAVYNHPRFRAALSRFRELYAAALNAYQAARSSGTELPEALSLTDARLSLDAGEGADTTLRGVEFCREEDVAGLVTVSRSPDVPRYSYMVCVDIGGGTTHASCTQVRPDADSLANGPLTVFGTHSLPVGMDRLATDSAAFEEVRLVRNNAILDSHHVFGVDVLDRGRPARFVALGGGSAHRAAELLGNVEYADGDRSRLVRVRALPRQLTDPRSGRLDPSAAPFLHVAYGLTFTDDEVHADLADAAPIDRAPAEQLEIPDT